MDFTLSAYKQLIYSLQSQGYSFQTLQDFIQEPKDKTVILRHDVDRKPGNALVIAKIEKEAGIKASYYFRIVKESYDEGIIRQIADMGHEIGYHYENLTTCGGDLRLAIDDFRLNLEKFRKLYPVKTICMHGSPLSKWDNRDLWKKYDYRDFGIIAEPYLDIDFDEVFYLTDTGRRWDGGAFNIRDKVKGTEIGGRMSEAILREDEKVRRLEGEKVRTLERKKEFGDLKFRKTWDIIEAVEWGVLPDKVMLNTHPQRWTDNPVEWTKELVWQNVKNVIKRIYVRTWEC